MWKIIILTEELGKESYQRRVCGDVKRVSAVHVAGAQGSPLAGAEWESEPRAAALPGPPSPSLLPFLPLFFKIFTRGQYILFVAGLILQALN